MSSKQHPVIEDVEQVGAVDREEGGPLLEGGPGTRAEAVGFGGQVGEALGGVLQEFDEVLASPIGLSARSGARVVAGPVVQSAASADRAAPEIVRKVRRSITVRRASLRAGTKVWGPSGTTPSALRGSQFGQSSARTMSAGRPRAAAPARLRGPGAAFESVTCRFSEPGSVIAEWDMYFQEPSAEAPPVDQLLGWAWPEWVTAPLNDGAEVFAVPKRPTQALANANSAELEELAGHWTTRLRSEDADDMTDDALLAVLQGVARLAASAVNTGGGRYSWTR
ncbi:hypothetical protein ACIRPU_41565 [Streptomyces sp. NPDC102259]|uniref:hypothetical protein n=1 Tax=Streptomyces sp. NPDC102259 TaxID=3366148 RepID=UPI0037FA2CB2